MRRRWLSLLLCLHMCLCALAVSSLAVTNVPSALRVNEAATRLALAKGQSKISLAVENHTARAVPAQIKLELLDTHDKVVARTQRRETFKPGASVVAAFLPVSNDTRASGNDDFRQLLWFRLRYEITPLAADAADGEPLTSGLISLSEITPDLFELRVSAANKANAGELYRVRVRAVHPLTSRPVRGVSIEGEVSFEDKDETRRLKLSATTGNDGFVMFDFKLPPRITDDDGEIEVMARRGDVVQTASDEISFGQTTRILLTSDKPLYQPGQKLHLRALLLNHATRRALAERAATLEIADPEGTTVFTASLKTSRFGIASVDWPIPDNTRLGDYKVKVETDDDDDSYDSVAHLQVKISRYDLPNFSVSATPDRGYYLPGESAQVEVRGDYLFGQPVKRGHVRLVREMEREWNYREQKYDVKEGQKYEGDLGDDGRFLARINLSGEHKELTGRSWQRFEDLSYAAYITDPTTNRTEQRRFRLRLTKEPIHIYITHGNYRQVKGLPLALYVSTSYADGTPAACEVEIAQTTTVNLQREGQEAAGQQIVKVLGTIKTNAYGVAKVSDAEFNAEDSGSNNNISIQFSAHDREGRAGLHVESIYLTTDPVIRIESDKAIYRAGESLTARVSSNKPDLKIFVDVVSNNRIVATETLRLHGGHALLEVPYRPEFQNRVTLAAYTTEIPESEYNTYTRGTHTVIYPRNRELKFDVRMSQASYQPGEEATGVVRVRDAGGRGVESALGVVVFDKAVEERARTEGEFGARYGFSDYFYQFWYGPESIGGLILRDIEQLNPARRLPAGLETVAELLLQRDDETYRPNFFGSSSYNENQSHVFAAHVAAGLKATREVLKARYDKLMEHPSNEASLRRTLDAAGIALENLRDPWGVSYRPVFAIEGAFDVLMFKSAGADKRFDTEDDWTAERIAWPYFRPAGEAINRAIRDYHKRTGNFIRDFATLKSELARADFDLDALRDRWGKPHRFSFDVSGTNYMLTIMSGGPDGRLEAAGIYNSDDFNIWTNWTDYFTETRALIDNALNANLKSIGGFPRDETVFRELLRRVQIDPASLKDPWGRIYYATFRTDTRYVDQVRIESVGGSSSSNNPAGQNPTTQRTRITPVTRKLEFVALRSSGADGQIGTWDDFNVAEFSHIVSDQSAHDGKPQTATPAITFSGETGAIGGIVTDPNGAAIPAAIVSATHQQATDRVFETTTSEDGKFLLQNLPGGLYTVHVDASGFNRTTVVDVPVQSATLATLNFTLSVGTVSETVEITASQISELPINGRNFSSLLAVKPGATSAKDGATSKPPISTPRLRKDFPETLYWQPAVETDRNGRTELRFKLADNITTWKMSIIGSTETGELGTVEREIRAFQPFFVEHDPPRILTEGDEINLPVVLRNYLDHAQPVALDIRPEDWFIMLGPARKETNVAAGDASRETFDFRAVASVKEGLQRITAIGGDASDQIEKSVQVHPDGEEMAQTVTQILRGSSALEVKLPADTVPRSVRAELKIYPNLMAHAIESVEAIMARPYGCAEQTISSTYPSLLVLRYYSHASSGDAADLKPPPIAAKAEHYVQLGYERLLSYRSDSGGFSYWGRGGPDLALTAYAVRFLTDAREFISVDESVLTGAREWLIRQQRADGSWTADEYDKKTNMRRTAMLTAYVARILAKQQLTAGVQTVNQTPTQTASPSAQTPLRRALTYLAPLTEDADEPYLIASYALAAIDGGESPDLIARATNRLRALAHDEASGSYWNLETNTPFYGWGLAGRIETTALVVQALTKAKNESERMKDEKYAVTNSHSSGEDLVARGLLFLLKNKDRYGVWLSTQATVNVLDALDVLSPKRGADSQGNTLAPNAAAAAASPSDANAAQKIEVFVNGQSAGFVMLPASQESANPLSLDLSRFVAPGITRVEIKRASGAVLAATAQLVTTYYQPWAANAAAATTDGTLNARPQDSRALKLSVNFDRTAAATGDIVTCRVSAERIGHQGYGMLLAEVGLPPGADVDRASLERAMKESGWEFSHYDVLPDRLVVYLWPRAGGTNFAFTFRPRFGLVAKSASSVVYDYYNPEARAVVAPTRFTVKDQPKPAPAQAKLD